MQKKSNSRQPQVVLVAQQGSESLHAGHDVSTHGAAPVPAPPLVPAVLALPAAPSMPAFPLMPALPLVPAVLGLPAPPLIPAVLALPGLLLPMPGFPPAPALPSRSRKS